VELPKLPENLPTPEALRAQVDDLSNSALDGLLEDLTKAMAGIPDTHRRLMSLTGVAWSDDRLVKAVVGPRGQLVDLEIDPRVFRTPDAQQLQASIVATVQAAVGQLNEQIAEIVHEQVPPEVAELRAQHQPDAADPMAQLLMSDAEIVARQRSEDGYVG
jgi:DNA-binding protein YbaB